MVSKIFTGLMIAAALAVSGMVAVKASSTKNACCYPGAPCCEAGLACCADLSCCETGAGCCEAGSACCAGK